MSRLSCHCHKKIFQPRRQASLFLFLFYVISEKPSTSWESWDLISVELFLVCAASSFKHWLNKCTLVYMIQMLGLWYKCVTIVQQNNENTERLCFSSSCKAMFMITMMWGCQHVENVSGEGLVLPSMLQTKLLCSWHGNINSNWIKVSSARHPFIAGFKIRKHSCLCTPLKTHCICNTRY